VKFADIPGAHVAVRVRSADGSSLGSRFGRSVSSVPVARVAPSAAPATFDLALSDALVPVTPVIEADARRLNQELSTGRALLAELADWAPDDSVELRIAFFPGYVADMGDVEIGVDDRVQERCRELGSRSAANVHSWLREHCTFAHGGQSYFFLLAGPAIDAELTPEPEAPDPAENTSPAEDPDPAEDAGPAEERPLRPEPTRRNSFCVTGSDLRFVATAATVPGGKSIYVVTRLTARLQNSDRGARPDTAVRLARGTLRFEDWTRVGRIQSQATAQLGALTADEASYLRKWDHFGDVEVQLLLRRARGFGALSFAEPVQHSDGTVSVRIIDGLDGPNGPDEADETRAARDALANENVEALEVVDVVPRYVTDPEFTSADFSQEIEERTGSTSESLKIRRYDAEARTLTLEKETLPPTGTLVLSLVGEIAQIRRRNAARKRILQGRSANPQLGLLIEERGEITSLRSPQRIKPLTGFVRAKVFRNPPTEMQERAIDVALNTPDIAVIQGPPGTGKTTVITAILERLNEIAAQGGTRGQGQVLLSGYQHDAVENMIDRISLNGIPVPKFGVRSGAAEEDRNAFQRNLEEWCGTVARDLLASTPRIAKVKEEEELKNLYRLYLRMPRHRLATTLVERIAAVSDSILGDELSRDAARLARHLATEELLVAGQSRHLLAAQRIRTRPASFADDGPERAEDALVDLGDADLLDPAQAALLDRASAWRRDKGAPPFLGELEALKRALLVTLTAPPVFRVEKHSDEVLTLAEAAMRQVRENGLTATDRKTAALAEFLAELESNPFGMVDAVADFSYAFSATVQQSVNAEMRKRKGISSSDDESLEYEYVIIDEAARVSPRDLMIPMAQGKKVILVGDHRQLPHMINEEVASELEAGKDVGSEADWLKRSMFEYLFSERLVALEKRDGIPRRVTLDMQFRMHPELGSFVSRNFYEAFDPRERFSSGQPASAFACDLPGVGDSPAIWLDVPAAAGARKRDGTSWIRQAEATAITRQLKDWLGSPGGGELSYGVISFYKAQALLIRRELRKELGAMVDDEKRVRIGTVDSFQGMEFDVVFLSIVRTVPQGWKPRGDPGEQARSLFGHLCLYNRLNVSMSRQRKLLVAVGDPALVTHPLAAGHIPGLVDFYKLARAPRPAR
jgi:AAA domain